MLRLRSWEDLKTYGSLSLYPFITFSTLLFMEVNVLRLLAFQTEYD